MTEDETIEVLLLLQEVGLKLTRIVEIVGAAWLRKAKERG